MYKIPRPEDVPPGGYRFFQAETQQVVRGSCWDELLKAVRNHRRANNLPIGIQFEQEIREQLCSQLPPGWCVNEDPNHVERRRNGNLGFNELLAATKALIRFKAAGSEKVSAEEAERRANICATCYENGDVPGCTPCNSPALGSLVESIVGATPTLNDARLKSCAVCGCHLKAKVHVPLQFLDTTSYDYPDWCWMKGNQNE
jgi:hypothetical protein